jgi:hypothetical protein
MSRKNVNDEDASGFGKPLCLDCAKQEVWHYRAMTKTPPFLQIPRFDRVDGFTLGNGEDGAPLELSGSGCLSLETMPPSAWPYRVFSPIRTSIPDKSGELRFPFAMRD